MHTLKRIPFIVLLLLICFLPNLSRAQEATILDFTEVVKAKVIAIESEETKKIPGTETTAVFQTIQAMLLEGSKKDQIITFVDDFLQLEAGDTFYIRHSIDGGTGRETYVSTDSYRLPTIILFTLIFIVLTVLIGGKQGVRGLLSLSGSLLLILFVLLPAIIKGYSPTLVTLVVASFIIVAGSYITHGFNKTTTTAVLGMLITMIFTGIMAYSAVHMGNFTGYGSEESVYITHNSSGEINVLGLLLSGIIIGLLGVLYDAAIGQAIAVEELHHIAPHVSRRKILHRALRMGREHIGALVDTLAIAYVGTSLPLLLLFYQSSISPLLVINQEVIAAEIIRALVGSIGLILAVPITTVIAVFMLVKEAPLADADLIEKEENDLLHVKHHH